MFEMFSIQLEKTCQNEENTVQIIKISHHKMNGNGELSFELQLFDISFCEIEQINLIDLLNYRDAILTKYLNSNIPSK